MIFGTGHGLASAKPWSQSQKETADIIVNLDKASDTLLQSQLHEGFTPSETRQLVQMMKANRLNVFGSGADSYSRIGLLPRLTALQVKVVVPARGATIKGVALLGASAADLSGVTKVDFYVKSDDGGHEELIGAGRDSAYGWIASFNTTTYPNGSYELRSVAYGYGGRKSSSPSVRISVKNHP